MTRGYVSASALRELLLGMTPRSLVVIRYVAELHFASSSQLCRTIGDDHLSGASRARASRRALARLVELDCLVVLPRRIGGERSGSSGAVYRLGLAGQRVAIHYGWLSARRTRRSAVPGSLFVGHALAVAEVHTQLVEADRDGRLELLERSAEPACWRSYDGIGGFASSQLKPDSFVRLAVDGWEYSVFIEADMGTEGSRTIAKKLAAYVAYHRLGVEQERFGVFPRVQWLTTTPNRTDLIKAEIAQLPMGGRELFSVAALCEVVDVVSGRTTNQKGDA